MMFFVVIVIALALSFCGTELDRRRQRLKDTEALPPSASEPEWWPEFEREFRSYAERYDSGAPDRPTNHGHGAAGR